MAGLQLAAVDQHPVGGEVGQPVGGRLLPGEVLGLGQQLLGLDLAELGERPPGRLIAPDLLAGRGQRVKAVDLGVLVGGLVAVDDDLVAGLPAGDALADLPHHPRRVRAADVMAPLGMVAVAPHADGLAQRGPHVVEVHAGRHHAHDHLKRAGLGHLDLLQLERVDRLALALLADDPRRHRLRQLTRLGVHCCDLAEVDGHGSQHPSFGGVGTASYLVSPDRVCAGPGTVVRPAHTAPGEQTYGCERPLAAAGTDAASDCAPRRCARPGDRDVFCASVAARRRRR